MSSPWARWNLNIHYHRVVVEAIPATARRALDVGCGNGLLSFELATRGLDVVGIDPNAPSIELARADAEASQRITFVCGLRRSRAARGDVPQPHVASLLGRAARRGGSRLDDLSRWTNRHDLRRRGHRRPGRGARC